MIEQATYVTKLGNLKISYEKEKSKLVYRVSIN